MSPSITEYFALKKEWTEKYKPNPPKRTSPIKVKIHCSICGSSGKMERHHKALDMMFAKHMPEEFAKRYLEFWPADVDTICDKHHNEYHQWILPLTSAFQQSYAMFLGSQYFIGKKVSKKERKAFLKIWKQQFKLAYEHWKKEKMK